MAMVVLLPVQGHAFSVTARVDRNEISINDYLELKILFDGGKGEVDTSPITDFQIVSQSSSSNVSIINGNYSKTVTAIFQLLPRRKGRLAIPALAVSYDGKIHHTQLIEITVSEEPVTPEDRRDIFVRAELSCDKLFVGQQSIYRFQLFSAVQFSNARLQKPEFEGFSVEEMGDPRKFSRTINGRQYNGVEIDYLIIPRQSGHVAIDPALLTCDVMVRERNRSRDPFNDPFFSNGFFSMGRTQPRRFSTKALSMEVMPLPPHEGTVPFSGLVGQFKLSATLDRATITAGDSTTLTVTISGTGNVMDAKMPDLVLPDPFKVYDDTPAEDIKLTRQGYQGSKIFKRALVPISAGTFRVPPLQLSYFDAEKGHYKLVTASPITLTVAPGGPQETTAVPSVQGEASGGNGTQARQVTFTGKDILALKEGAGLLSSRFRISMPLFICLYLSPFMLFFLIQVLYRMMRKGTDPVALLSRKAVVYLRNSEKEEEDDQIFLRNLYMAVMCRILARGREPERSMTIAEACELLHEKGVATATVNRVEDVMHDIESARYGQAALDVPARKELLVRVKGLVKLISLVLIIGMLTCTFPSGAVAREAPHGNQTLLVEGISDYKAGRFSEAAEKFVYLAVQEGIENGELYYNAGNAFLKAGDTGRAILWYERAQKLIPHDPDLRFNLAHARTFVKDKADSPGLDITGMFFFWKNYLPLWLMIWTAIGLSATFAIYAGMRSRRGKRVFTLAGVIFFMAVALAGITVCYDYYEAAHGRFAVILADEAAIRSGLSPEATPLFLLHAGTRVRVEEDRDGYLKIIFSRGKIGWVSGASAEMI